MRFPFFNQLDIIDCGPACLRMIAKHHGKVYSAEYLREKCFITRDGVSMSGISEAAESIGLRSLVVKVGIESLQHEVPLPCIAHWRQRHFVVVYEVTKKYVFVADPDFGLIKYTHEKFREGWINSVLGNSDKEGFLLLLEPTPAFYEKDEDVPAKRVSGLRILFPYFKPFRKYINQLFVGLILGTAIQIAFPFLTQSIVDHGIKNQNINFIYIVLLAQLMLFFSQTLIEVFRGWLLLHMGSRINISIVSDFLMKLMRLPIAFFESRRTADIFQRVEDNHRIESFLSSLSLTVLFSFFNLFIFSAILAYYNVQIFAIFFIGAVSYVAWVVIFMKKRALLDFRRFDEAAGSTSGLVQLINGIQEIKLNNSERRRRWEWENIQAKIFKISVKGLALTQYQSMGAMFINELKNIIITFFAAHAVIEGKITLGMMLAIQYIIGQMNAPLNNFISFIQRSQDARISLERLAEIQIHKDENEGDENSTRILLSNQNIQITNNLCFRYGGKDSPWILNDLNLEIPSGKVTAIVGASGSGKTTLLKLLLKFYKPSIGNIKIGMQDLQSIQTNVWRDCCGVVMQDGFIFSDTIARNITESSSEGIIDKEKLQYAVKVANLEELIESLPGGYTTKIGGSGLQLSGGQQQRILLARIVYKNPEFLFFDEATSALDANNERTIMDNLQEVFKGKTVVIIAHRLSTVKNAHKIVVLDKGKIVEEGKHEELTQQKGAYFTLVKNQLELGN